MAFNSIKTIRVFSAPFNCPYCDRAKALLERFNLTYVEVIGILPEGRTTYPQIMFDDVCIGGCNDLFSILRTQEVKTISSSCSNP